MDDNAQDQSSAPDAASALMEAAKAASQNGQPPVPPENLQDAAQQAQQQKATDNAWTPPDFVPENFRGKSAQETMQNLVNSVLGYRERDAKAEKIPETPEGYEFQISDNLKAYMADNLADDPIFQAARSAAHELQIPPTKFQAFLDRVLGSMVDAGAVERPMQPQEILQAFVPESARQSPVEEQMREAGKQVMAVYSQFEALAADKKLPDAVKNEARILFSSPAGVQLLSALLPQGSVTPDTSPKLGGQPVSQAGETRDELKARQADPRNDPKSPSYDPRFAQDTRALYQKLYRNG